MHHYLKDLLVCWCTSRLVPCFGARDYCNNEHGYASISGMHCVRLGPFSRCITRFLRKPPIDFSRATPVLILSTAPALHTLPYICCLFSWRQLLWLRWDTVFKIFISVYVCACVCSCERLWRMVQKKTSDPLGLLLQLWVVMGAGILMASPRRAETTLNLCTTSLATQGSFDLYFSSDIGCWILSQIFISHFISSFENSWFNSFAHFIDWMTFWGVLFL